MEWYGLASKLERNRDELDEMEPTERGLFAIAWSIDCLAYQLRELGKGDASSPQGAIEHLAGSIDKVATALNEINETVDRM